jgi:hypothetical protein
MEGRRKNKCIWFPGWKVTYRCQDRKVLFVTRMENCSTVLRVDRSFLFPGLQAASCRQDENDYY